jgi:hypothetical protein
MDRRVALLVLGIPLGLFLASAFGRAGGSDAQGATPLPSGPVLVIVVERPADLAAVREVIAPERIVANSLDGFVVREGRVVVGSIEAAGPLLSLAGWVEAELEVVHVDARQSPSGASAQARAPGDGLSALYGKATLTLPEAIRALQLLQ